MLYFIKNDASKRTSNFEWLINVGLNKSQMFIFLCYKLYLYIQIQKAHLAISLSIAVVPPGIEPGTPGFSVLCSTN